MEIKIILSIITIAIFIICCSSSNSKDKILINQNEYLDSVSTEFLANPSSISKSFLINNKIFISQDYWMYAHKEVNDLKSNWRFLRSDWTNPKFEHTSFIEKFENYGKKKCFQLYTKNREWEVTLKYYIHKDNIILGSVTAWSVKPE